MSGQIQVSDMTPRRSVRGVVIAYDARVEHLGLHEVKVLSARETYDLLRKIDAQISAWNEKWKRVEDANRRATALATSKSEAERLTANAQENLNAIRGIFKNATLADSDNIWNQMKVLKPYQATPSGKQNIAYDKFGRPSAYTKYSSPQKPSPSDRTYTPTFNLFDHIIPSFKRKKIEKSEALRQESKDAHNNAVKDWENQCAIIDSKNTELLSIFTKDCEDWDAAKSQYDADIHEHNASVDALKTKYISQDQAAITEYTECVLNSSPYPDIFQQTFRCEYNDQNKILIIDYMLPEPDTFPTVQEVRHIASKQELKQTHITDSAKSKLIDDAYYGVTMRTIYELFATDTVKAFEAISFNGWVDSVDPSTGHKCSSCILSIQIKREEFNGIQINSVDPKACFKKFRGIGSSKLSSITPIQPLMTIDRSDSRFIDARPVVDSIDEGTNLAAMDWSDFEHLIRELFEQEFSSTGGEVRITQASRDRGVDAIAFDPDPIRGGKIVIQAKRYTNTVDVACVRDLYGTVHNEGAIKGILVTTTDFGPDAYDFAKDKPITLLSGGNLLHLLSKHGHKAHINVNEAKRIAGLLKD